MATPAHRWGWHRLNDRWAARLVADAHLPTGALVLDVGAGDGAITRPLLHAGARVIAVEAHPHRAAQLRAHARSRADAHLKVVRADAADLRLPRQPFHVVANPPFSVTTALLRRLLQPGSRMVGATLILQRQAAQRWAGRDAPGAPRWHQHFVASLGPRVPRHAFDPRPPVDARVLVLRRRRHG